MKMIMLFGVLALSGIASAQNKTTCIDSPSKEVIGVNTCHLANKYAVESASISVDSGFWQVETKSVVSEVNGEPTATAEVTGGAAVAGTYRLEVPAFVGPGSSIQVFLGNDLYSCAFNGNANSCVGPGVSGPTIDILVTTTAGEYVGLFTGSVGGGAPNSIGTANAKVSLVLQAPAE